MALIDHASLARYDLNLLVAFEALIREGSVTRAAESIGITQSSMSHRLARLRTTFDDELFVRAPGGMAPTPRARALAPDVSSVLAAIATIVTS